MKNVIHLNDIELMMHIGVKPEERSMPQRILATIDIDFDFEHAALEDNVAKTVDYRPIMRYLKERILPMEFKTIEALARNVADAVRYIVHDQHPDEPVGIHVTISKPDITLRLPGYPSISYSRHYDPLRSLRVFALGIPKQVYAATEHLFEAGDAGYIHIENVLEPKFLAGVLQEIEQGSFAVSPPQYGQATQDLSSFIVTTNPRADEFPQMPPHQYPFLHAFQDAVGEVYHDIGIRNTFDASAHINHICVHKYGQTEMGISAHRDESRFKNCIFIFSLTGTGTFRVGTERSLEVCDSIQLTPNSLTVLRAPRNAEEKDLRPMHAVGPITEPRISVMFRAT